MYKAQFSFTLTKKQNAVLTIEAKAWDTLPLPGGLETKTIYVYPRHTPEDNGNTLNDNSDDSESDESTPGFELVFVIVAVALVLFLNRKRRIYL